MICCTITIVPFVNQGSTTVPYTGNKPTVSAYYNIDGIWQDAGVATLIEYGANSVTVHHGGPNTGAIKLIQ